MKRSISKKQSPVRVIALYNVRLQSFHKRRLNAHTVTLNEAQAFKKILNEVYPESRFVFNNYEKGAVESPFAEQPSHTFSEEMKKEMSSHSELFMEKDTPDVSEGKITINTNVTAGNSQLYGGFADDLNVSLRGNDSTRRLKLSNYASEASVSFTEGVKHNPSLKDLKQYQEETKPMGAYLSSYNKRVQMQNPHLSYQKTRELYDKSRLIEYEQSREFFYGTITASLLQKRIHLRSDRRYYTLLQGKPIDEEECTPKASRWVVLNNIPKDFFQDKEELKRRLQYQFRRFGNIKSVHVPWAFFQSGRVRARKSGDKIVDKVESQYQDLELMKEENDNTLNELDFMGMDMNSTGNQFSDSLMTDYGLENAQNFDPIEFFSNNMEYESTDSRKGNHLPYAKFDESLDDMDHHYEELNEDESVTFRSRYEEYEELNQQLQDIDMKDSERFQRALQTYARKMRNKGQIYRDYIYRNDDDSLVYVEFEDLESKELAICPQLRVFGTLIHNHLVYAEDADRKTNLRIFLRRSGMTIKDYVDIVNNLCRANHIDAKFFTTFSERSLNGRLEPELENIILIKCNSFEETFRIFKALDRYNESTNGTFFYPEITIGKAQYFGDSNRYNFLQTEFDEKDLLDLPLRLKMQQSDLPC